MAHLFTNRRRVFALTDTLSPRQFLWESINAILYLVGGVTFVVGSIFFLPSFDAYEVIGAELFFGGSILYLIVSVHDLVESVVYLRRRIHHLKYMVELLAAVTYCIGTVLFLIGSVLFMPSYESILAGSLCFIIGSGLFLVGACINVLQIVLAGSLLTLQLLNATAISFIAGSVLFLVASVPYLWTIPESPYKYQLFTYVAWEYIVGSMLFFGGGVVNYIRAGQAMRHYVVQKETRHSLRMKKKAEHELT
ncbi:YrhK family protein [Desulfovibrio inopinatus]|uniref:YrhK family protein n=1 Tax=Desulfovibrio inopinatus TaxID=102109 RepID=UPI0004208EAC|nr:YrhK family protein [Desulfovibrio inopinatus]